MPLKTALKYLTYSLVGSPISAQKKAPGNIGEGISSDADVNKKKKAIRIASPLTTISPLICRSVEHVSKFCCFQIFIHNKYFESSFLLIFRV